MISNVVMHFKYYFFSRISMTLTAIQRASLRKRHGKSKQVVMPIEPLPKEENITIEQYINNLQEIYKTNVKQIKGSDDEDYIKASLIEGEDIWINVQMLVETKDYENMNDSQKIDLIQKDFPDFYKNFPIVSRYAICMKQYSQKAFKKMLIKCLETKMPRDAIIDPEKKKGLNEKLWIERQADYIRFLWEDMQGTFEQSESDNVWKQASEALTKEFAEFKELHDMAEKNVKEADKKNKSSLLYEMCDRIITGTQTLQEKASAELLFKLQNALFKQRKGKMLKQVQTLKIVEPILIGIGTDELGKQEYDEELKQAMYKLSLIHI